MEKLTTQTVYTTIAMKGSGLDLLIQNWVEKDYLRKHTDKYPLSKEQIIKLVGDAFNNGEAYGHADGADILKYTNHPDKQTYIDNLFK